jgi:hypothetical protein
MGGGFGSGSRRIYRVRVLADQPLANSIFSVRAWIINRVQTFEIGLVLAKD